MPSGVVANRGSDILRDRTEIGDQLLDIFCREVRVPLESCVGVGDVGVVMSRMVYLHRARVDVGLESIISVREIGRL